MLDKSVLFSLKRSYCHIFMQSQIFRMLLKLCMTLFFVHLLMQLFFTASFLTLSELITALLFCKTLCFNSLSLSYRTLIGFFFRCKSLGNDRRSRSVRIKHSLDLVLSCGCLCGCNSFSFPLCTLCCFFLHTCFFFCFSCRTFCCSFCCLFSCRSFSFGFLSGHTFSLSSFLGFSFFLSDPCCGCLSFFFSFLSKSFSFCFSLFFGFFLSLFGLYTFLFGSLYL